MKKLLFSITLLLSVASMYCMELLMAGQFRTATLQGKDEEIGVTKKSKHKIRRVALAVEQDGVIKIALRRGDFSPGAKSVQIKFVSPKK